MEQRAIVSRSATGELWAFWRDILAAWPAHAVLQASALGVLISGHIVSAITGFRLPAWPETFVVNYVVLAALYVLGAMFVMKLFRMVLVERPQSPARELGRWFGALVFDRQRLANGIHGMTFVFLLMSGFALWKNQVARIFGFSWDEAFHDLDRILHLDALPHEWLHAALGTPLATAAINWVYLLWFPALFASCLIMSFQPERSLLRHRFMHAFLLCWVIGGVVLANLLSSAGPAYYSRLVQDGHQYAAHFDYLRWVDQSFHLTALELQELLWGAYAKVPSYSTISAMPSLHVTIAMLLFLIGRHLGRPVAAITGGFAALILVGSIYLGWHYAVDGYAGIALALACWGLARPLAQWDLARTSR